MWRGLSRGRGANHSRLSAVAGKRASHAAFLPGRKLEVMDAEAGREREKIFPQRKAEIFESVGGHVAVRGWCV